jgi:hypothetical protein
MWHMGTARKPPAGAGETALRELAKEITDPVGEYWSVAAWHRRAFAALNRLMGPDSIWSREFNALADELVLPDPSVAESWDVHEFEERFRRAIGVLMAAAEDLQGRGHEASTRCSHEEKEALLLDVVQEGQPDGPLVGSVSFANLDDIEFDETVFLVHGHNGAAKHEVARFVERITGKPPVILDEQSNRGQTLVEKFETHAATAAYAIVLATPDDVGRINGTDSATDQPRARQNVVFELGYFFGKLGRDRVTVLNSGVEKPSDVDGLVYIDYPAGNWQVELAKELYTAGVSVNMTRLLY